MNRHKAYWSVMGVEPTTGHGKQKVKLYDEIQRLIDIHGLNEVTTAIRILYEKNREEESKKACSLF